jgi:hypothetical protein
MKFQKILQKIKDKKKILISVVWAIAILYITVWIYSFIFEQNKLAIDRYNFEQLEKAKPILERISKNDKDFDSLKKFNEQYKADIKPIENCYYVSNYNWKRWYIFWFQLKALINKFLHPFIFWYPYISDNYAYPKYSIPWHQVCFGAGLSWGVTWGCYDNNYDHFRYVSNSLYSR